MTDFQWGVCYKGFIFLPIPDSGDGSPRSLGSWNFQGDANGYACGDLEKKQLPNDSQRSKSKEVYHYVSLCKFPTAST